MKKLFTDTSLITGVATIFAGVGGVLYSTHRDTVIRQEIGKLEHERIMGQQKLDWEKLELEKYKLNLPSKFEQSVQQPVKVDTPVSDYIDHKIKEVKVLENIPNLEDKFKNSVNSPNEELSLLDNTSSFDLEQIHYVSSDVVNYAGLTILGCVITIASAFTMVYLNHLTLQYSDENIHKAPDYIRTFYKIYKHSLTFNTFLLKMLMFACALLIITMSVFLITM